MCDVFWHKVDSNKLTVWVRDRGSNQVVTLPASGIKVSEVIYGQFMVLNQRSSMQPGWHGFRVKAVGVATVCVITMVPIHEQFLVDF